MKTKFFALPRSESFPSQLQRTWCDQLIANTFSSCKLDVNRIYRWVYVEPHGSQRYYERPEPQGRRAERQVSQIYGIYRICLYQCCRSTSRFDVYRSHWIMSKRIHVHVRAHVLNVQKCNTRRMCCAQLPLYTPREHGTLTSSSIPLLAIIDVSIYPVLQPQELCKRCWFST